MTKVLFSKDSLAVLGMLTALYFFLCIFYCTAVLAGAHTGSYMPMWHWPLKLLITIAEG